LRRSPKLLAASNTAQQPARLLDIGYGDGTALIPALSRSTHIPAYIDLIEPSAALLKAAVTGLRAARIPAAFEATDHWQAWAQVITAGSVDLANAVLTTTPDGCGQRRQGDPRKQGT
jgi:tRNA1(Val) A37 N6-methylase TrmN6